MIAVVTKKDNDSLCVRSMLHQLIDQGIRFKGWEEQELPAEIPDDLESYPALIVDEEILHEADDAMRKRLTEYASYNYVYVVGKWLNDPNLEMIVVENHFVVELNIFQAAAGLKREEFPPIPEEFIIRSFLKRAEEYFAIIPQCQFFNEYHLHFMIGALALEGTPFAPAGWSEHLNEVMEAMFKNENIYGDHDQLGAWMLAPLCTRRSGNKRPMEFLLHYCDEIIKRRPRTPEGLLGPGGFVDDPLCYAHKNSNMFGANRFTTARRNLVLNEQLHFLGGAFAAASAVSGDMKYLDEAMALVDHIEKFHRDPADGLLFHASLRGEAIGEKWGRGNTHALLGALYMLQAFPEMPEGAKNRIISFLDRTGKALIKVQCDSGLWRNVLNDPAAQEETSCTLLINYIYAWGVNRRIFDRDFYLPMIEKSRNALLRKFWRGFGSGNCRGSFPAYQNPWFYAARGQHMYNMPLIPAALIESKKALAGDAESGIGDYDARR